MDARGVEQGNGEMMETKLMEEIETQTTQTASPPDRLSVDPKSPHYNADVLARGIGIRFNGVEKTTIEEYCISEGWVRIAAGKARDRRGNPVLLKLKGEVVAYSQDVEPAE
jgi:Protein of unknown function (DUF3297)